MNISHEWLKDFVDHDLTPAQLRDLITARAATVDAVEALRTDLAAFVVAHVVERAPHPDSDHLSVTKVDAGTGELLDVVCGASNVRAGGIYPFAKVGTKMPGGLEIQRRKIRGAVSNGMLCSPDELGLGTEHDGLLELHTDAAPGTPFLAVYPAGDTRLVLDVLPNRPDLLSHIGVAREVAAALGKPLQEEGSIERHAPGARVHVDEPSVAAMTGSTGDIAVAIQDVSGCPRYMGVVIRGVNVGPSPQWLADRMTAVGSRSINNVVDITNYMLHGYGQPMHAFDAQKLGGKAVIVRRAHPGETLRTLDGVDRTLTPSMLVIADGDRAQGLAGIMGGGDSEVSDETTDIFLEAAAFEPRSVRQTRKALGLSTDASYRFERGTDIAALPRRVREAVQLICAVAGGRPERPIDLYPSPVKPLVLQLRVARTRRVLGDDVPAAKIVAMLGSIGYGAKVAPGTEMLTGNEAVDVHVPAWRTDVRQEVDLIEDVARLHGYDALPSDIRPFRPTAVPDSPLETLSRRVRDLLVGQGIYEIRPMPFVSGADDTHVRLRNPLAENEAHFRRSLLETLGRRAEYNLSHKVGDIRLFEVGDVLEPSDGRLPRETARVGVLLMGRRRPPHFTESDPPAFDEWDAKGVAERLAAVVGGVVANDEGRVANTAGALWSIRRGDQVIGAVSRLKLDAPVWAAAAYGIEMELAELESADVAAPGRSAPTPPLDTSHSPFATRYEPLPTTPASEIDLALVVPDAVPSGRVGDVIRASAGELLERLELFDQFRGTGVPAGHRSLAWRLTFRDATRTLRDKEIEGRTQKILRALEGELGVRPRAT
jgi:phenylalanyl-tRNA synthetase beta chain